MTFDLATVTCRAVALCGVVALTACASLPFPHQAAEPAASAPASKVSGKAPAAVAAASASASSAEASAPILSVAEQSLSQGLKSYQSGQYPQAETQLKAALKAGLTTSADVVVANKHLAFIYCTSKREALCVAAFKAARAADPAFALSKTEAGHPLWSKPYKKALGLK
jgi:hypothetical protein